MTLIDKINIIMDSIPTLYQKTEYAKCREKCNELIGLCDDVDVADLSAEMEKLAYEYMTKISEKGLHEMTFKELLQSTTITDAHLVHSDIDMAPTTMAYNWNITSFTNEGIKHYDKLMNAIVCRIFQGIYGLQIELTGVSHKDIEQFNSDQCGYCSDTNYKKWFTETE